MIEKIQIRVITKLPNSEQSKNESIVTLLYENKRAFPD
jgi:hypothetical protein